MNHESNNQQTNNTETTKSFHFNSLAPNDNIDNFEDYDKWLKEAIEDERFGNISITGDLGIGKSSVIRTFERKNNLKFTYLSASDLVYTQEYCFNSKKKEVIQQELEKYLLIQLIAMCKKDDIPLSHFKSVPENPPKRNLLLSCYPTFSAITILCIFKFVFRGYLKDIFPNHSFNWILILIISLYLFFSVWGMVKVIIQKYKLPKFSYKLTKGNYEASAEFEQKNIEPENLDNNLHEILYIIEQLENKVATIQETRKPVIIIEDLDRYPGDICIPILSKFKQINDLLNQRYRQNNSGYGKHFKFIYVLRDEIFEDDNNTKNIWDKDPYKFFDVIIPIVPKLGFGNSFEEIKKLFSNYSIENELIDKITYYLYDYRKLNDIKNEFDIYCKQFSNKLIGKGIYTKLLAFIIYKVFYSQDYYELYKIHPYTGFPKSEFLRKILFHGETNEESLIDDFKKYLQSVIGESLLVFMNFSELKTVQLRVAIIIEEDLKELNGINLKFAKLNNADLRGVDFRNANLSEADLSNSKLNREELHFGGLVAPDFTNAILEFTKLNDADLRGANLTNVNLSNADLTNANLSCANLTNANLFYAKLINADLSNVDLTYSNLTEANFMNSDLTKSNLTNAQLFQADLRGANINDAILDNVTLISVKLLKSDLAKYNNYIRNKIISIMLPTIYDDEINEMKEYYSYTYNSNKDCFELLEINDLLNE